ncbi:hypothetical protein K1X76_11035, partial [bacterium]|nr:hypothetical protein [bacterium]
GDEKNLQLFIAALQQKPGFEDMFIKYAFNEKPIFKKQVVHVKKEIVTLKRPDINPTTKTAPHLNAKDWNKLLEDKNVVVIDTRNDYEYKTGTFPNSINPQNKTFGEFPNFVKNNTELFKNKKIAMFCTGGIRCEKATSLMLDLGYNEVYQLDGGIWNYLDTVPKDENKWIGECFVFDDRITVDTDLDKGSFESFTHHEEFVASQNTPQKDAQ